MKITGLRINSNFRDEILKGDETCKRKRKHAVIISFSLQAEDKIPDDTNNISKKLERLHDLDVLEEINAHFEKNRPISIEYWGSEGFIDLPNTKFAEFRPDKLNFLIRLKNFTPKK